MYNRIYKFFSDMNLIYSLQFGFKQKYSRVHVLIRLTENFRKNLYEENIDCSIFVDLQNIFDTVEYENLLSKLKQYGIRCLTDECFKSFSQIENNMLQLMVMILISRWL